MNQMKNKIMTTLLLAGMLLLNSCSETDSSPNKEKVQDSTTDTTSAAASAVYDYVHGTDGYYNLAEELKYLKMPVQTAGTCWLHAARASMQTSYEKSTGKVFEVTIDELLNDIYSDSKQEGFFINEGVDKYEVGGWQWIVTERMSRGFGNGLTLDSSVQLDVNDRESIKTALKERGAVAANIMEDSDEIKVFGQYMTIRFSDPEYYDHDISIIGYDDHFPKEYFKTPAQEDGAWIAYNSNAGYMLFYISYESPLGSAISHGITDKYAEVLSYDAGNELDRLVETGDSTKTANVFHKKGKLAAVGTFNDCDKQEIKIEIMSADFKDVLYTQDAVLDYHGYHTVELTTPVDVEDYAVVITYTRGAPVEGELITNESGFYKTVSEKGQSFVFVNGEWKDVTDDDIKTVLKTDFAPGNCCIKALYAE